MEMTFDQYIQNPMGKDNAVISNREVYRALYRSKLDKIMVREAGKIDYHLYKKKDSYVAYLRIPSESIEKFYYDVLIEFTAPKKAITGTTLKDYNVKFYSNDPSFVFTFAHAFIENDLFFEDMKNKMSKEAIKKEAKEKNPKNQVGYVKSLFFAYLIMSSKGLFAKVKYVEDYDKRALDREIIDADTKIQLRLDAQENLNKKKRKAKAVIKKQTSDFIQHELPINMNISNSNKIKYTAKSKTIGGISRSNTIKKSKTVGRK